MTCHSDLRFHKRTVKQNLHSSLITQTFINLRILIFRFTYNRIDDGDEAEEANHRSYLHTAHAEDVVVEHRLVAATTTHKDETKNDNQHAHRNEDEVGLVESIISFVHDLFVLMLNFIQVSCFHAQELVHGYCRAYCRDEQSEEHNNAGCNSKYFPCDYFKNVWLIHI